MMFSPTHSTKISQCSTLMVRHQNKRDRNIDDGTSIFESLWMVWRPKSTTLELSQANNYSALAGTSIAYHEIISTTMLYRFLSSLDSRFIIVRIKLTPV